MQDHLVRLPDGQVLTITVVWRADWGAGPFRAGHPISARQLAGLVLHHTYMVMRDYTGDGLIDVADVIAAMRHLQRVRPDLGGEVPYSWVIIKDLRNPLHIWVCEGRGSSRTGAHTAGLNSTRLGVALFGNYTSRRPDRAVVAAIRWLAAREIPWATVPAIGHRDAPAFFSGGSNLNATACPALAHGIVAELHPPYRAAPPPAPPEEDIMATIEQLDELLTRRLAEQDQRQSTSAEGRLLRLVLGSRPLIWVKVPAEVNQGGHEWMVGANGARPERTPIAGPRTREMLQRAGLLTSTAWELPAELAREFFAIPEAAA